MKKPPGTPRTASPKFTARRRPLTEITMSSGQYEAGKSAGRIDSFRVQQGFLLPGFSCTLLKKSQENIYKKQKNASFSEFLIKKCLFQLYNLYLDYCLQQFTIQTNFLTVYSFAFAGLLLPTGRQYTFMYILDLFLTRQPSMRFQKNFGSPWTPGKISADLQQIWTKFMFS